MLNKKTKIYNRRYEKIAKIGEGTFGKVMLVVDIESKPEKQNDLEEAKSNGHQDLSKLPIFAIKKSKAPKHQNLQVFYYFKKK